MLPSRPSQLAAIVLLLGACAPPPPTAPSPPPTPEATLPVEPPAQSPPAPRCKTAETSVAARPDPAVYRGLLEFAAELSLDEPGRRLRPDPVDTTSSELEGLGQMLAATPRTSPDRPRILARLAQLYMYVEGGVRSEVARAECPDPKVEAILARVNRKAVEALTMLAEDHPAYCTRSFNLQDPGCADAVIYRIACEEERSGHPEEAFARLAALVRQWPRSRYAPAAHFWFAERLAREAGDDRAKWAEVIKVLGAALTDRTNPVAPPARYLLAQALEHTEGRARARQELQRLLAENPGSHAASLVPEWAR